MALETRVTRLLKSRYPVIGGCLMHISGPEFVAAVCNAGAFGMLASAMYDTQDGFRQALRRLRRLTDQPFGVNMSLHPAIRPIDNQAYVQVVLEEGVRVVETSGHRPPPELFADLKAGGVTILHKCVSVRHARSAQAAGADAVTVFGTEGGGHIGEFGLTTMVLVPRAADALQIPVIAAGGIADGRGMAAALALGAEGVTIGTRLLLTEECPIHPRLKEALLSAGEEDTTPVLAALRNTMRAWRNAAALRVSELEMQEGTLGDILAIVGGQQTRRMYYEGMVDEGVVACSQAVGLMDRVRPVAEVVRVMADEAEVILGMAR